MYYEHYAGRKGLILPGRGSFSPKYDDAILNSSEKSH